MTVGRMPRMVGDDAKLPLFHGNGTKGPKQYWLFCETVWIFKQNLDDDVNKGQLATNLRGQAVDLFMKFVQVPTGTPVNNLVEIRKGLIEEFRKLKSEAQYITELKEIKKYPNETIWDFNQ